MYFLDAHTRLTLPHSVFACLQSGAFNSVVVISYCISYMFYVCYFVHKSGRWFSQLRCFTFCYFGGFLCRMGFLIVKAVQRPLVSNIFIIWSLIDRYLICNHNLTSLLFIGYFQILFSHMNIVFYLLKCYFMYFDLASKVPTYSNKEIHACVYTCMLFQNMNKYV